MYVVLNIIIPTKIDKKQKKLFEELATTNLKTSDFKIIDSYLEK